MTGHDRDLISPSSEYLAAPNSVVSAANGIDYAYRQVGEGTPALVLLQHFRGNLVNWDPPLVDALARDRRVVTFDNGGVGVSTGTTARTIAQMARDAIAFLEALELGAVDLLGFSSGSFVAQEIALIRPALWVETWGGWPHEGRSGQADDLADPAGSIRRRVSLGPPGSRPAAAGVIGMPVFVANGDGDPMILPHISYLLAGLIPQARVKIYPDAASSTTPSSPAR